MGELRNKVHYVLAEEFGVRAGDLVGTKTLREDLGLDSLDCIELAMDLDL